MRTIESLNDLIPYGIFPDTGETDSLMFRMLCNLNEQGTRLIADTYGLSARWFMPSQNRCQKDVSHIGCVMLPYDAWKDIGILAMLGNCDPVIATDRALLGIEPGELFRQPVYNQETQKYTAKAQFSSNGTTWTDLSEYYSNIIRIFSDKTPKGLNIKIDIREPEDMQEFYSVTIYRDKEGPIGAEATVSLSRLQTCPDSESWGRSKEWEVTMIAIGYAHNIHEKESARPKIDEMIMRLKSYLSDKGYQLSSNMEIDVL